MLTSSTSTIKMNSKKPPLGLRPRYIAEEMRIREIEDAVARYKNADKVVPSEWVDELLELRDSVRKHNGKRN